MTMRQSTVTCPHCGHTEVETMPVDACQWAYDCRACGTVLTPKHGDCCIFCSYGSVPCPPVQEAAGCAGAVAGAADRPQKRETRRE